MTKANTEGELGDNSHRSGEYVTSQNTGRMAIDIHEDAAQPSATMNGGAGKPKQNRKTVQRRKQEGVAYLKAPAEPSSAEQEVVASPSSSMSR